ncbi:MAG TPA: class I SAM-dependent methyltransferase [Actinomycetota bacterium]
MGETPALYDELADWWPLLSAPEEYADEAAEYERLLVEHADGDVRRVLELGSGGGNNASHLKRRFELTLVDRSPGMLAVSARLNPECEHVEGDMRAVRLGRSFDAVFVHDAIAYITTEEDLEAVFATAFEHCRPGGVALFVPDDLRETFVERLGTGGHDGADRALRYLEWSWDPDPSDSTCVADFAYLLRLPDGTMDVRRDRHVCGLFPRSTWLALIERAGFEPDAVPLTVDADEPVGRVGFLGRRRV